MTVTDVTVSPPNFIRSVSFDNHDEAISLLDHSALHLDQKYF